MTIQSYSFVFRATAKRAGLAIAKQIAIAGGSPPDCQVKNLDKPFHFSAFILKYEYTLLAS